jgi:hypothetical protein
VRNGVIPGDPDRDVAKGIHRRPALAGLLLTVHVLQTPFLSFSGLSRCTDLRFLSALNGHKGHNVYIIGYLTGFKLGIGAV